MVTSSYLAPIDENVERNLAYEAGLIEEEKRAPKQDLESIKTDPNSVYRRRYVNDLQFQLFVIDRTPPDEAITIKVHIEPAVCKEFTDQHVRDAVHGFIVSWQLGFKLDPDEEFLTDEAIEVRQFPRAAPKN